MHDTRKIRRKAWPPFTVAVTRMLHTGWTQAAAWHKNHRGARRTRFLIGVRMGGGDWRSWDVKHMAAAPAAHAVVVANAACVDERGRATSYSLDPAIGMLVAKNVKHGLHPVQNKISQRSRALVLA